MAHITLGDAQAWIEPSKLTLSTLDTTLENAVSSQVFAQLGSVYNTADWVDEMDTPDVIRGLISMYYVSWIYDRTFSSDGNNNPGDYATRLRQRADMLLTSIVAGDVDIPEQPTSTVSEPSFYPNDASSALEPSRDDPSLGPAAFTMGTVW